MMRPVTVDPEAAHAAEDNLWGGVLAATAQVAEILGHLAEDLAQVAEILGYSEQHGHHVGHRWRTAPPEGDWWPERHDTPTPATTPPPRLPRGVRDNLED